MNSYWKTLIIATRVFALNRQNLLFFGGYGVNKLGGMSKKITRPSLDIKYNKHVRELGML